MDNEPYAGAAITTITKFRLVSSSPVVDGHYQPDARPWTHG